MSALVREVAEKRLMLTNYSLSGPACRGAISKNRLFVRDAFMPSDADLGLADPLDDEGDVVSRIPVGLGSKSKRSPLQETTDDDGEVVVRRPRFKKRSNHRSARSSKDGHEVDVDSADSMEDFIVEG